MSKVLAALINKSRFCATKQRRLLEHAIVVMLLIMVRRWNFPVIASLKRFVM